MNKRLALFIGLMALGLAACGGGGGGGGVTPPTGGPTPCPAGWTGTAPNCVAPPTTATASGKLVDFNTGNGIAGTPVAIASWAPATSAYTVVATTDASGNFSFTTAPGQYLMKIGSDSPTDTRPTIHDNITLKLGANPLVAPTMPPQSFSGSTVTPPAIEASGNYRLATISAVESNCLTALNTQRGGASLGSLVPDEWLIEDERNYIQLIIMDGQIGGTKGLSGRENAGTGGNPCAVFENTAFVGAPTDPQSIWWGGEWTNSAPWTGGATVQEFMHDPRTESGVTAYYYGWP